MANTQTVMVLKALAKTLAKNVRTPLTKLYFVNLCTSSSTVAKILM
jgi:hypothetical protein